MRAVSLCEAEHLTDRFGQAVPLLLFICEVAFAGPRQSIQARTPVVLRNVPLGLDPACVLHAVKRRIERALFDAEDVSRDGADVRGDAVAVLRAETERLQDQKVQRALKRVGLSSSAEHLPRSLG